MHELPLSIYIHLPWCIKKCPYCDFNSHLMPKHEMPESDYITALQSDIKNECNQFSSPKIVQSIFFGGGTPSLFSGESIKKIIDTVKANFVLSNNVEITLEVNPGSAEYDRLESYLNAGVNRLSIGIQSFNKNKLKAIGRIHNDKEAYEAIEKSHKAGLKNINLDIMYGLPNQKAKEAAKDIEIAVAMQPSHISYYQLTLEPNTLFYKNQPNLPDDKEIYQMQNFGQIHLEKYGYNQYEVSAYAKNGCQSQHNLNYWQFGDYLGIGAGAHSKMTYYSRDKTVRVLRNWKEKNPKQYIKHIAENKNYKYSKTCNPQDVQFEFLLNALRLKSGFAHQLFVERTGLQIYQLEQAIEQFIKNKLLINENQMIRCTTKGYLFIDSILSDFLLHNYK